jgi:hypothetical protein
MDRAPLAPRRARAAWASMYERASDTASSCETLTASETSSEPIP